ncbi:hypothetical protein PCHAJ_000338700 [Plasmodium chabaudi chabaudi]|uniref:Uncharacterized protein n=1 Tax=Plasmodium chabaudi chabaudi TaxID=31271 RepID=A0A1C6YPE4_PLACU|nr:hypothetical protein PCHAJ_000338700 [Plasmodium chabaudi chabaudi]
MKYRRCICSNYGLSNKIKNRNNTSSGKNIDDNSAKKISIENYFIKHVKQLENFIIEKKVIALEELIRSC